MGYSGRYHAASLAAVFVALAIGIVIGVGLADDVVSGANEELVDGLRSDLDRSREESDGLQDNLDRERRFTDVAAPALTAGRLERRRVVLVFLGSQDEETEADVTEAIEQGGGQVAAVAVVGLPPDLDALGEGAGPRFDGARRDPDQLNALGEGIGRQLIGGGDLIERTKGELFDSLSGDLTDVDSAVLVQGTLEEEGAATDFENGLLSGITAASLATVGVERTTVSPTSLGPFIEVGISTVDHIDVEAGQVALVYALGGSEGNFGVKDEAGSFLPELTAEQDEETTEP